MFPGFLSSSRAGLGLDVVAAMMLLILPVMAWSIWAVRHRGNHALHRRVQTALGIVLLIAVGLFEIDIRVHGWRHLATVSPFYETVLFPVLYVHLFFAVSTTLLWAYVIPVALRRYRRDTGLGTHAARHRFWARLAALDMCITACTGWIFYYMAFVAT